MSDMDSDRVHAMADQLRQYATHFEIRDWDYTRDLGDLRPLHFGSRWPSVRKALHYLVHRPKGIGSIKVGRVRMARSALRSYNSQPDGVLDGGNIITNWEEHGEYLQYVQPSVGAMFADWLDDDCDSPHAHRIAAEMKRINDSYGERVAGA